MQPFLSIIIPTYNRQILVSHTIDSTLQFIRHADCGIEIIVVDDASDDGTFEFLQNRCMHEITSGAVKLIRNRKNLGVTGAKNTGAANSKGKWLLFIDSDDLLIPDAAQELLDTLKTFDSFPIIFFRCRSLETGELTGPYYEKPYTLAFKDFLNIGTPGECLPVVRASAFEQCPYYSELRGCEGLAYARIIRRFGPARVEALVAREYRTDNNDRLCSGKGIIRRACYLAKYNNILLTEFKRELYVTTIFKTIMKLIYYQWHCFLNNLKDSE
ncbi:MAG: glycosyltransferase family 2 protein [Desulfobacteraceae bacterium]|nr:glycosyltransferase family 2 protein [Desulfobacteraceae bacterium]